MRYAAAAVLVLFMSGCPAAKKAVKSKAAKAAKKVKQKAKQKVKSAAKQVKTKK